MCLSSLPLKPSPLESSSLESSPLDDPLPSKSTEPGASAMTVENKTADINDGTKTTEVNVNHLSSHLLSSRPTEKCLSRHTTTK